MSEGVIGTQLAVRAINNILVMLLFTPLQKRLGTVRTYQAAMAVWPVAYMFFPLLNFIAKTHGVDTWVFNGVLMLFFTVWSIGSLAWRKSFLLKGFPY